MSKKMAVALAVIGILLPYAIGIGGTAVLGNNVGNLDFYHSGKLAASDHATFLATLIAYGFGLVACVPLLRSRWTSLTPTGRLCMCSGVALFAVGHFVAVFAVRFLYYIHAGGVFP